MAFIPDSPVKVKRGFKPDPENPILSFGKSLVQPLVDYGKFVGEAGAQVGRVATDPTFRKSVFNPDALTAEENTYVASQPTSFFVDPKDIANPLKTAETGLKRAAGAGAYFIPMGGTIPRMIAGGALSGGMLGLSEGDNIDTGNIFRGALTGGALSGGLGLLGKGFKNVFSGATKKVGSKIESYGEGMATKGLGNPMKLKTISKKAGRSLADIINEYKLYDRDPETAQAVLNSIVDQLDQFGAKSNKAVKLSDVVRKFDEKIAELGQYAGNDSDNVNALIEELIKRRDQLIKRNPGFDVSVSDLTNYRRNVIDKDIPKSMFNLDARGSGTAQGTKESRDILRKSLIDAHPELEKLGLDYGAVKELIKVFENAKTRPIAKNPVSVSKLMAMLFGGATGGVSGAIIAGGAEGVVNNPQMISRASRLVQDVGSGIKNSSTGVPNIFKNPMVRSISRGAVTSGTNRLRNDLANRESQESLPQETGSMERPKILPLESTYTDNQNVTKGSLPIKNLPKVPAVKIPKQNLYPSSYSGNTFSNVKTVKKGSFY